MANRLICGDVLEVLPELYRFKCLIADPPDNFGLGYADYYDKLSGCQYENQLHRWLPVLANSAEISWISFNAKWVFAVGEIVNRYLGCYDCRLFIQSFTFGQNRNTDCGNGYRPILRIMRRGAKLYPAAIKVPSWRQKNGDKRAAAGGRVPLDYWDEFPRITGNGKERRAWHPTQLREAMVQRMVNLSTLPGESVCDCFSGTGTVLRAVKDRHITSIELSPAYCEKIGSEHGLAVETFERKRASA